MGKGKLNKIFTYKLYLTAFAIYYVVFGGLEQIMLEASSCNHGEPTGSPNKPSLNNAANVVRPYFYPLPKPIVCSVTSSRSKITFKLNGKSQLPKYMNVNADSCSANLTIKKLLPCHSGTLYCFASNVHAIKNASIPIKGYDLTTQKDFRVEENTGDEMIIDATNTLKCTISKAPFPPETQLFFGYWNGSRYIELKEDNDGKIFWRQPENLDGGNKIKRSFEIRNVTVNDARTYICKALYADNCLEEVKRIRVTVRHCRTGHYCDSTSGKEEPCEEGHFNNKTGVFSKDGCIPCPTGHYCEKNCSSPVKCPPDTMYDDLHASINLPLSPAKSKRDCRRCPLKHSCSKESHCDFLCAQNPKIITHHARKMMQLSCNVSDRTLVKDLKWIFEKQSVQNDTDHLYVFEGKLFKLLLSEAKKDAVYNCEGTETNLGKRVYKSVAVLENFKSGDSATKKNLARILSGVIPGSFIVVAFVVSFMKRNAFLRCFKSGQRSLSTQADDESREAMRNGDMREVVTSGHVETFSTEPYKQNFATPVANTEMEDLTDNLNPFDVFICYSSTDRDWVRCTLLQELEARSVKACIDFRDFEVGGFIVQNIADAIYRSRKTIAVLSPDFIHSVWCKHELQMALSRIENHQVIPILFKDCEVPQTLMNRTYLDWSNPDVQPHFWDQIVRAIGKDTDVRGEATITSCKLSNEVPLQVM